MFQDTEKTKKILILYWLPTNTYILDIKYKLHLIMLGKKFSLKKIFLSKTSMFWICSFFSPNVKKIRQLCAPGWEKVTATKASSGSRG